MLLSVPTDGRYPAPAVSPQQKREMTLAALLDQLDGEAAQGTVLIVVEDAHWIDPTSLDLLDRTVARAADLPLLLLITLRPEVEPAWVGQPHVTILPLSRLGRRDSVWMLDGITKGKALPNAVVEQVLAHTDGVPLFIEELTSTLLESGVLRETPNSHVLDAPLPPLAIPTTLQASLVARLDRLGSVKEVAQIGATIGREFSHELIAAVSSFGAFGTGCGARAADGLGPHVPARNPLRSRLTPSSTRWCRTPPTPRCSRAGGGSCMPASPPPWRSASQRRPTLNPSCLHIICPRQGGPIVPFRGGVGRASGRGSGQRTSKP